MLENASPGAGDPEAPQLTDADQASGLNYSANGHEAQHPDEALIRIIARLVWPSLQERPDPSGLRQRWDALHEETGEVLVASIEHPLVDGAYVLAMRGVSSEALVTMRHEGSAHDSFKPMPLRLAAAAAGEKRAEGRSRITALHARGRQATAAGGSAGTEVAAPAIAAPLGVGAERGVHVRDLGHKCGHGAPTGAFAAYKPGRRR